MFKKLKSKLKFSDLIKKSSLSFGLRIIGMGIGYIFTLLISNYYGAEALGLYALSFVFLQMVSMVSRLGMDMALLKFLAEYQESQQHNLIKKVYSMVLKLIFPLSILLSIAAFFASPYIAKYIFDIEHLTQHLQIASLGIFPYTLIFIHSESLRGLHKITAYMFLNNICTTLVGGIIIIILFNYFQAYFAPPILVLVISLYVTFIVSIKLWKKSLFSLFKGVKSPLNKSQNSLSYHHLFSVALPMTLTAYLSIVMGSTDTIMLGMYATEKEVGIYSVIIKLTSLSLIIFMAVNTLTTPKYSAYWGGRDLDAIRKLCQESTKLILFASLPIFIVIWSFPNWLLSLFGAEFQQGFFALIIMTIGQFLFILVGPVWQMMNMTNKQKVFLYFSLISASINVVLNYTLIPLYGLEGAAFSTVMAALILNILSVFYIKKEFGVLTLYIPTRKL